MLEEARGRACSLLLQSAGPPEKRCGGCCSSVLDLIGADCLRIWFAAELHHSIWMVNSHHHTVSAVGKSPLGLKVGGALLKRLLGANPTRSAPSSKAKLLIFSVKLTSLIASILPSCYFHVNLSATAEQHNLCPKACIFCAEKSTRQGAAKFPDIVQVPRRRSDKFRGGKLAVCSTLILNSQWPLKSNPLNASFCMQREISRKNPERAFGNERGSESQPDSKLQSQTKSGLKGAWQPPPGAICSGIL